MNHPRIIINLETLLAKEDEIERAYWDNNGETTPTARAINSLRGEIEGYKNTKDKDYITFKSCGLMISDLTTETTEEETALNNFLEEFEIEYVALY